MFDREHLPFVESILEDKEENPDLLGRGQFAWGDFFFVEEEELPAEVF